MTEREWNRCFEKHQRKAVLYRTLSAIAIFGAFVLSIISGICLRISILTMIFGMLGSTVLFVGGLVLMSKSDNEFQQGRYDLRHRYYTPMDEEKEMGLY